MLNNHYDICIIGGGLGGLTLSITLRKKGFSVLLIEKETYPFHKVCGEYISNESRNYLQTMGVPFDLLNLPQINRLQVSSPSGNKLSALLSCGGFGISRYKLDELLKNKSEENGVTVIENCKAENVEFHDDIFTITTTKGNFTSAICCGSWGKRSNLDVRKKRNFISSKNNKLNNYIAVKYHVKINMQPDLISLHNFKEGYCGISAIEENKFCLCYITNAENLYRSGNSIENMERNILCKNPELDFLFRNIHNLYERPVTISQISFDKKSQIEDHILLTGDAAGLITPLCGNGMSMAMQAGKIASGFITEFLTGKISRNEMEVKYINEWQRTFKIRLKVGRTIQRFFGKEWLSELFISSMKIFPGLTRRLISLTHGSPY